MPDETSLEEILHLNGDIEHDASLSVSQIIKNETQSDSILIRFSAGPRQVAFARRNDILFVEIQDHLLLVHIAANERILIVTRHQSLKDFSSLLQLSSFLQLKRFYLINTQRITGAHADQQWFEFDFKFRIPYKHYISPILLQHLAH